MFELVVDTSGLTPRQLEPAVEKLIAAHGLSATLKGTTRKFPGSIHWHLKKGRERGTLEITLHGDLLWFSMHENRSGEWIIETAHAFKRQLERASASH